MFAAEFKRAVKVATGQELSNNLLDTVFKIFDLDGDECLSHGEFLGVLKNRMHRGLWVTDVESLKIHVFLQFDTRLKSTIWAKPRFGIEVLSSLVRK